MTIEITKKHIVGLFVSIVLLGGTFTGGYFIGKKNTVPKEDYTTARQYAIHSSDMVKALFEEFGKPQITSTDFITNAREIATMKAKATGKPYSEVKGTTYTLYDLMDATSFLKEE